jgi:hypothetical protein
MMRKIPVVFGFLFLAACDGKVESTMELVKSAVIENARKSCMEANKNRDYCDCEAADLEKSFPWDDYMKTIDILAGEQDHVAKVIERLDGSKRKILKELNCDNCYFSMALVAVDAGPGPRCAEFLK